MITFDFFSLFIVLFLIVILIFITKIVISLFLNKEKSFQYNLKLSNQISDEINRRYLLNNKVKLVNDFNSSGIEILMAVNKEMFSIQNLIFEKRF